MNIIRESIETSYTNFKLDLGVSGLELMEFPIILIAIAFMFGAGYTIARTLTQIHVNQNTFIQKDFIIGSLFICLAVFNIWTIFYMDIVLDWFDLMPYTAYALSIIWLLPAIIGLNYFEEWRNKFINPEKKGIKKIPDWVLPVGSIFTFSLIIFGGSVFIIEYSMNLDCSRIGTGEDSTLTEQEAIKLRDACESSIDNTYVFAFIGLPVMAIGIFLSVLIPILRMDSSTPTSN